MSFWKFAEKNSPIKPTIDDLARIWQQHCYDSVICYVWQSIFPYQKRFLKHPRLDWLQKPCKGPLTIWIQHLSHSLKLKTLQTQTDNVSSFTYCRQYCANGLLTEVFFLGAGITEDEANMSIIWDRRSNCLAEDGGYKCRSSTYLDICLAWSFRTLHASYI